ncbi:MAG: tRNA 2-selenouridine(34) synthase MnmH [Bacteroidales bacterium]
MGDTVSIEDFFKKRHHCPIIDVRSPSEYNKAHIPGAINIPLFTDDERALVGTKYIQESRYNAVIAGLDAVGPKLSSFVNTIQKITASKEILVYCWRGGMRSKSMTWLFNLAGYKAKALEGGYKSYRRKAQECFESPFRLIVMGGMTGSGKTELLLHLKSKGEQVVDLEGLANHKGSAFGWIGQEKQPSTEFFENLLFEELLKLNPQKLTWVEDESKSIGTIFIPQYFYQQMIVAKTISINVPFDVRLKRLVVDYTNCNPNDLIQSVNRITKRLGFDKAKKCIDLINQQKFEEAVAISLAYYDKTYRYGLENKVNKPITIDITEDLDKNIENLLTQKVLFENV